MSRIGNSNIGLTINNTFTGGVVQFLNVQETLLVNTIDYTDKFLVEAADGTEVFKVDTVNKTVSVDGIIIIVGDIVVDNLTIEGNLLVEGPNNASKVKVVTATADTILNIDTVAPRVDLGAELVVARAESGSNTNIQTWTNSATGIGSGLVFNLNGHGRFGTVNNTMTWDADDYFPSYTFNNSALVFHQGLSSDVSRANGIGSVAFGGSSTAGIIPTFTTFGGFYYTFDGVAGTLYLAGDQTLLVKIRNTIRFSYADVLYIGSLDDVVYDGISDTTSLRILGSVPADPTIATAPQWGRIGGNNIACGTAAICYGESSACFGTASVASGYNSFVMGSGCSGENTSTVAFGQDAHAVHISSFVWGDGSTTVNSLGDNTFNVCAANGTIITEDAGISAKRYQLGVGNSLLNILPSTTSSDNDTMRIYNPSYDDSGSLLIIPNYSPFSGPATDACTLECPSPSATIYINRNMYIVGGCEFQGNLNIDNQIYFPLGGLVMQGEPGTGGYGALAPSYGGDLGTGGQPWNYIYLSNAPVIVSDRNQKESILPCNLGLDFINKLLPVSYKLKDKPQKTMPGKQTPKAPRKRTFGLIAQDVVQALDELGIVPEDTGIVHSGDDGYGLAYDCLIPALIKGMQELSREINSLKAKLS